MRGEVVLVTGGSGGIGVATARAFVREGARVVLAARDREKLEAAAEEVGGKTGVLSLDAADRASVATLAREMETREGRLDVLVNCAGVLDVGPAVEAGPEIAERLIRTNYLGTVDVIHALLPLLRAGRRRSIVNVSSVAGKIAPPYMAAYAGSKFALTGYTHALRQELRREGVHVSLVSPGPVDTPMIAGRVGTPEYPLPPGVDVVPPERVAHAILRAVEHRLADVVVPGRLSLPLRFGLAFPRLVDWVYRPLLPRP